MKKVLRVLILGFLIISLTGCVKLNVNMDIKKDKSMEFSMIYAINKSYYSDDMGMSSDDKKKITDAGFSIEDYDDGSMKGYKMYKSIKNIDEVSSTDDVIFNMEELDNADGNMFKVKKGIFKNTYTAKLSSVDLNDMNMSGNNSDNSMNDNSNDWSNSGSDFDSSNNYYQRDDFYQENESDFNITDPSFDNSYNSYGTSPIANYKVDALASLNSMDDFSQMGEMMMSSMDLSFIVNLPYSAKTHNATSVNNSGKQLQWNLANQSLESIDFEFELYNWTNIYLTIAIAIVLIAIVVKVIIDRNKKNTTATMSSVQAEMGNPVMPSVGMDAPTPIVTEAPVVSPAVNESPATIPAVPTNPVENPVEIQTEISNPIGTPMGLDSSVSTQVLPENPAVASVISETSVATSTDAGNSTNDSVDTL